VDARDRSAAYRALEAAGYRVTCLGDDAALAQGEPHAVAALDEMRVLVAAGAPPTRLANEGYTASAGPDLHRTQLTDEAIRLTRQVWRLLPSDGEVAGLLALMLLTDARRPSRTRPDGSLVPLAEQDRARWDRDAIQEGIALITHTLSWASLGPYQIQAALAALHAEAVRAEDTDWPQILALYQLLERLSPGPMVTLNRAVAVGMVHGPQAGLEVLTTLDADDRLAGHHRLDAVRVHLLELAGDKAAARAAYRRAARRTTSLPEQRYLEMRAARLKEDG
jgi:predicted RNA polymerase sigma factor